MPAPIIPLLTTIGPAVLRALPVATRSIIEFAKKYGNTAAAKEFGKGRVQAAAKAAKEVQPVKEGVRSAGRAVKRQANKVVGKGDKISPTKTGEARQARVTSKSGQTKRGQLQSKQKTEKYEGIGKARAARRAKTTAKTAGALGTAGVVADQASQATAPKKTGTPKGQMKRGAKKTTPSTGAKNYNVGVSKGGVSFKEAFRHFRNKGAKTFTWNGKKYTTELKKGK